MTPPQHTMGCHSKRLAGKHRVLSPLLPIPSRPTLASSPPPLRVIDTSPPLPLLPTSPF